MLNLNKLGHAPKLFMTICVISILSGCGGQAYKNDTTTGVYTAPNNANTPSSTSTPVPSTSPSTTPSTGNGTDSAAALGVSVVDTDFSVYGTRGLTGTPSGNHIFEITDIATDNLVNLVFTSSNSAGTVDDTGYQINYNCIKFQIQFRDQSSSATTAATTKTVFLSNTGSDITTDPAGVCSGAVASATISYTPVSGHGLIKATIVPQTFDNCGQAVSPYYGWGAYWAPGCGLNLIAQQYKVSAHVITYVNGN